MSSTPTARGFPPLKQVFAKNYEDFLCKSDSSCGVMHTLPIIPDWLPCKVFFFLSNTPLKGPGSNLPK